MLAAGFDVPYVQDSVGHADPTTALAIYAPVIRRADRDEREVSSGDPGRRKRPEKTPTLVPAPRAETECFRKSVDFQAVSRWAVLGSNQWPPACKRVARRPSLSRFAGLLPLEPGGIDHPRFTDFADHFRPFWPQTGYGAFSRCPIERAWVRRRGATRRSPGRARRNGSDRGRSSGGGRGRRNRRGRR
jgi:hypothetical protein